MEPSSEESIQGVVLPPLVKSSKAIEKLRVLAINRWQKRVRKPIDESIDLRIDISTASEAHAGIEAELELIQREGQLIGLSSQILSLKLQIKHITSERNWAREDRDRLEQERGDWVPGAKCVNCEGSGTDNDGRTCSECSGTGDVWKTWKQRFEELQAKQNPQ